MIIDDPLLYKTLSELGVIDKALLDDAFEESKDHGFPLGELLLQRDLISDENLGMLVADIVKLPFVRLDKVSLEREVLEKIPEEMARARGVIVFKIDESGIHVALRDAGNLQCVTFLKKKFGSALKMYYATERDIRTALFAYRRDVSIVFEEIINRSVGEVHKETDETPMFLGMFSSLLLRYSMKPPIAS